ncbi:MAG: DUF302 domain-containing protein [Bacteroidales bacterium]|nr:DUF302 domain-containing protein [Bacteroidales bacterium]
MKFHKLFFIIVLIFAIGNIFAQSDTQYYFSKKVNYSFEEATTKVKATLKEQGFGIVTELDMDEKIAEKIKDADLKPYKILGACNPGFALETLKVEENIGLFLPCKVLVKQLEDDQVEVVMVNPSVLMGMLGNEELMTVADEVTKRFKIALENL